MPHGARPGSWSGRGFACTPFSSGRVYECVYATTHVVKMERLYGLGVQTLRTQLTFHFGVDFSAFVHQDAQHNMDMHGSDASSLDKSFNGKRQERTA